MNDCIKCPEWQRLQRINTKLRINNEQFHQQNYQTLAGLLAELDRLRVENQDLREQLISVEWSTVK